MDTDGKIFYVVFDRLEEDIAIYTTKSQACSRAKINVITLDRAMKQGLLHYENKSFVVMVTCGINKHPVRVKNGKNALAMFKERGY
jgi:hypothetical protein